jgi:hypothetical protein
MAIGSSSGCVGCGVASCLGPCALGGHPCARRPAARHASERDLSETVPKSEHDHPKVQVAAASLAGAAEGRDFVMHAKIAVIQALKRNDAPPPLRESGKQSH